MAECATAGTRGGCCSGAVGPVRNVLPFAISKLFVVSSETLLLPHHKYGRQVNRNETAVGVQNGLAGRILLHGIALEQDDRAIWKIEHLSGIHRSCGIVAINFFGFDDFGNCQRYTAGGKCPCSRPETRHGLLSARVKTARARRKILKRQGTPLRSPLCIRRQGVSQAYSSFRIGRVLAGGCIAVARQVRDSGSYRWSVPGLPIARSSYADVILTCALGGFCQPWAFFAMDAG